MGGFFGTNPGDNGVVGQANSDVNAGVNGRNDGKGFGVFGFSQGGHGVEGHSAADGGVVGFCLSGAGVRGTGRTGVAGQTNSDTDAGVNGRNDGKGFGVFGFSQGGAGVEGHSDNGDGVVGVSNAGGKSGVVGINNSSFDNANGVFGFCRIAGNAIHGVGGTNAGLFEGTVVIQGGSLSVKKIGDIGGEISADGGIFSPNKHFVIDHPCDPANKLLYHCSVESPEMLNVYNGNVTTDVEGEAWVTLPDYFEALNCDFRYQLTAIGQFSQAIIATEIAENRFCIRTDRPNVKVSWQVSGVRKDVYAKANPVAVEQEKSATEKGFYLHPRLYGKPQEKRLVWVRNQVRTRAV
jgi:hypothetical protein